MFHNSIVIKLSSIAYYFSTIICHFIAIIYKASSFFFLL
jgi:hypothetical protein